ncbi:MAG: hypothetical protein AABY87_12860, partial [bacterium]
FDRLRVTIVMVSLSNHGLSGRACPPVSRLGDRTMTKEKLNFEDRSGKRQINERCDRSVSNGNSIWKGKPLQIESLINRLLG